MAGIYVHIPFCASRCAYCAFHSTTRSGARDAYVSALCSEIDMYRGFPGKGRIKTLYFGGGTPSQLSTRQIYTITDKLSKVFDLSVLEETTLECNPDDITKKFLSGLNETPVTRISMGIQSLNDSVLSLIRRRHTASQALSSIRQCQEAGFSNISIDLIYGLPGQSAEEFRRDILRVIDSGVTHISAYCLTYEEGTPMHRMLTQGDISAATDDECALMYGILCDTMRENGFLHYEISNFCLPGYHSRHNSSYWDGTPYLGLGSGAHSFDGSVRRWNVADIDRYMLGIASGEPEYGQETLTETDRYNEFLMLSLRTTAGISLSLMRELFGVNAVIDFLRDAGKWIQKGDLIHEAGRVRFSESGLFTSDGTVSSLFRE